MLSATNTSASAHVPAWKRLGLKLKSQAPSEPVPESSNPIESPKRKREDSFGEGPGRKTKIISKGLSPAAPVTPILVRKKSVTFTPETKADDGDSIKQLFNSWVADQKSQDPSFQLQTSQPVFETPEPSVVKEQVDTNLDEKERRAERVKKPRQDKKKSLKPSKIAKPADLSSQPYLQYLRQYHESRDTWKFNKNHQTHLLKHVFDLDIIPSNHAYLIYPYVRGLQGGVRTRLRDAALAVKIKDQEESATESSEIMSWDEKKQKEYEAAMEKYARDMTATDASSQVGYEEGILLGLSDEGMAKRVAKRTRAEQILRELAAGQDPSEVIAKDDMANGDNDSQKRLRMNDGSTQKVARRRKQRTAAVDTSSSESEDSEDDSSDDSVSENDGGDDTSSSSSSSSSASSSEEDESPDDSDDSSEDSEHGDE
jgi:hypothetical protein